MSIAPLSSTSWSSVAVLGAGKTGRGVIDYLLAHREIAERLAWYVGSIPAVDFDALKKEYGSQGVALYLEDALQDTYDLVIASPGIPPHAPLFVSAQAHAHEVIGEPEFGFRMSPERWIALTGTNGKTTTTTLLQHILRTASYEARAVGNIGELIVSSLDARTAQEWFVAELSSFQLFGTTSLAPEIALLLNITPDHIEWHGSEVAYAEAKAQIFAHMRPDALRIISLDDTWCAQLADDFAHRGLRYAPVSVHMIPEHATAAYMHDGDLMLRWNGCEHHIASLQELPLIGLHNAANMLAASLCAYELGISTSVLREALCSFQPLPHRMQTIGTYHGLRFINDSKATNTDAAIKALESLEPQSSVILLGGYDKHTDLRDLADVVVQRAFGAVCFGAAGMRIMEALSEQLDVWGSPVQLVLCAHLAEAVEAATEIARPGMNVLLSPACSSFDEFANMAERGERFAELVKDFGGIHEH